MKLSLKRFKGTKENMKTTITLLLLSLSSSAFSQLNLGSGTWPCDEVSKAYDKSSDGWGTHQVWIYGYLTALSTTGEIGDVDHRKATLEIVNECRSHPKLKLHDAVKNIYHKEEKEDEE